MFLIEHGGEISIGPEMAHPTTPQVDAHGVCPMSVLDRSRQRLVISWHNQPVHMVAHEAEGPEGQPEALAVRDEPLEVGLAIPIIEENTALPIAAVRNVQGNPWQYNPRESSHAY